MKRTDFEIRMTKGSIGEKIVEEYFEERGWIIYRPKQIGIAHYFDMLLTKNKEIIIAVDVKTKARLNKWNAQGIDKRNYDEYMAFTQKTKIPFYIIFIDDKCGDIHAAELSKLKDPIAVNPKIIAWSLDQMFCIDRINTATIEEMSQYDQRSYAYAPS